MAFVIGAVTSCSNDGDGLEVPDSRNDSENEMGNPGIAYFESITSSDIWQSDSFDKRCDALNLPENILNNLTTVQLTECCIEYPFWVIYNAHNEPIDGVKLTINGFNGFAALRKQSDHSKCLIDAYEDMSILYTQYLSEGRGKSLEAAGVKSHLVYFTWIFCTEFYPETLKGENGKRLRPIVAGIAEQIGTTQLYSAPRELLKLIDSYAK